MSAKILLANGLKINKYDKEPHRGAKSEKISLIVDEFVKIDVC